MPNGNTKAGLRGSIEIGVDAAGATALATGSNALTAGSIYKDTAATPNYYIATKSLTISITDTASLTEIETQSLNKLIGVDGTTTAAAVCNTSNWKLNLKSKSIDVPAYFDPTAGGDIWDETIPGSKSFDGSIEGSYKKDDVGQGFLSQFFNAGKVVTLKLYIDKDATEEYFSGPVMLEEIDIEASTSDVIKLSTNFKGAGKPSHYTW